MRVLCTIAYDGTLFYGYQIQKDKRTVELVLEEALEKVFNKKVKTFVSGRTDSGVHAKGQKIHFDIDTTIPVNKFPFVINEYLPSDCRVLDAIRVSDDFNVRFSAKKKTYSYTIYQGVENPLYERYAVNIFKLDVEKIKEGAKIFEGTHDYKCCLASGSSVKDTIRTIFTTKVIVLENHFVKIYITGNGFLYNMVRIMVGTLVDVALGRKSVDDIKKGLDTGDRSVMGKTMPSKGLCLESVEYDEV